MEDKGKSQRPFSRDRKQKKGNRKQFLQGIKRYSPPGSQGPGAIAAPALAGPGAFAGQRERPSPARRSGGPTSPAPIRLPGLVPGATGGSGRIPGSGPGFP